MVTMTAEKTKRAIGYTRVSTINQAGEKNISLDTQLLRYRQYCEAHGYQVGRVFTDIFWGRKDDRKA
jgi:DNA invertase Pin-like site-specific DNA recombinase